MITTELSAPDANAESIRKIRVLLSEFHRDCRNSDDVALHRLLRSICLDKIEAALPGSAPQKA